MQRTEKHPARNFAIYCSLVLGVTVGLLHAVHAEGRYGSMKATFLGQNTGDAP